MLTARDIKDKRIELVGQVFVAEVHLMNGVVIPCGRHLTLYSAQVALAKYPPDVFEGVDDPNRQPRKRSNLTVKGTRSPPGEWPRNNLSMRERYLLASRKDRGAPCPGLRTEEECANWEQPYTRLYERRC